MADLDLNRLHVIHAGEATFPMSGQIEAVALRDLVDVVKPLR
ncbi:MAG: hypothetical protein AB7G13_24545 [Lautropia sp.]